MRRARARVVTPACAQLLAKRLRAGDSARTNVPAWAHASLHAPCQLSMICDWTGPHYSADIDPNCSHLEHRVLHGVRVRAPPDARAQARTHARPHTHACTQTPGRCRHMPSCTVWHLPCSKHRLWLRLSSTVAATSAFTIHSFTSFTKEGASMRKCSTQPHCFSGFSGLSALPTLCRQPGLRTEVIVGLGGGHVPSMCRIHNPLQRGVE